MGSYKALYRKYRPQTFSEVVDQEYITRTIKNAIKLNRISHAYLFNGPRGIGKTSIARIFAKAINCLDPKDCEPCCECDICKSIVDGTNPDIIEIDAASRTKVEQMRETLERVSYLPSMCKYKVYIIDEVHMLSASSFNALLKTLEEPPSHVIFILCTTEVEKVIPTIRSRCQRFDFHLVSKEAMTKRLRYISDQEGINITDDALSVVAEASEGGMRDSLSLLDQISSFSVSDQITADDVLEVSGGLSARNLIEVAKAINEGDSSKSINALDELIKSGKDIERINQGLITFFKDILVEKNTGRSISKVGYDTNDYRQMKDSIRNERLFKYIEILTSAMNDYRFSTNKRLYFEIALIKMCELKNAPLKEPTYSADSKQQQASYDPNKTYVPYTQKVEEKQKETIFSSQPAPQENPVQQPEVKVVEEKKEETVESTVEEPSVQEQEQTVTENKETIATITTETQTVTQVSEQTAETTEVALAEEKEEQVSPIEQTESKDLPEEKTEQIQNAEAEAKEEFEYDVTFVEKILNNANKQFKQKMISMIEEGKNSSTMSEFFKYSALLTGGKIEASSSDSFVITFQSVGSCNLIMKDQNKKGVQDFVEKCIGVKLDFLALTTVTFKQLSDEFVKTYRANVAAGIKEYIRLTPVHCKGLKLNEQVKEERDVQVENLKKMFGDILTVKD